MRGNVRHLRPVVRPYDHERDEDLIHVGLTPVEWSLLVTGAERGPIVAAHEVAACVAAEVKQVQHLRIQADIADATYDYSPCEWQDGA